MLKKLLCIVAFMLALVCVLASCGDDTSDHIHTYGEWSTAKAATCTDKGSEVRVCECGKKDTRSIPATGHKYGEWVLSSVVNCLESVPATRTCSCGVSETGSVIGAHDMDGDICKLCCEGRYIYTKIDGGYRIDGLVNPEETDIVIPVSYNGLPIKAINDYAFYGCTGLKSVTINMPLADEEGRINALTTIGISAFSGCTSLESITIPTTLTEIGKYAFFGCESLERVDFEKVKPASTDKSASLYKALSVGSQAFSGCEQLSTVYVKDLAAWCETLFADATSNPLYYSNSLSVNSTGASLSIAVPNSAEYIGSYAFVNYALLESVTLSDNISSIGDSAFRGCVMLEEIVVSENVVTIGNSAFEDCASLNEVVIPDGVMTIGNSVFQNCISLESVAIPDSVVYLGAEAFMNCYGLESVKLSEGINLIDYSTFHNCVSLESITIPAGIDTIGNYAFYCCVSLNEVHVSDLRAWCEIYFKDINSNPLTYASELYVDTYNGGALDSELVTELVVPTGTKYVGDYAFYNYSLTSVVIPGTVYSIGISAFEGCTDIVEVMMYDGVANISEYAFKDCSDIQEIALPKSIVKIGASAFDACSALSDVNYRGTEAEWSLILIGTGNEALTNSEIEFVEAE